MNRRKLGIEEREDHGAFDRLMKTPFTSSTYYCIDCDTDSMTFSEAIDHVCPNPSGENWIFRHV